MAATDEDEWEYEYGESETEDFYIPVDLAHVPDSQVPTNVIPKAGHPMLLKTKLRALNASRREPELTPSQSEVQDTAPIGEIQITGLHTSNPLIMYNDQLLSCQWASTVGTDLLFTTPAEANDEANRPLRSLPSVDLLAQSSAKLIARAARLRPRDDLVDKATEDPSSTARKETSQDTGTICQSPEEPIEGADVQGTPPASSSFLSRLNAAKAKRGDKSRLVVSTTSRGAHLVVDENMQSNDATEEAEDTDMSDT